MDILKEILIETISNCVWVLLVLYIHVPKEIINMIDQKTPLQEEIEKDFA